METQNDSEDRTDCRIPNLKSSNPSFLCASIANCIVSQWSQRYSELLQRSPCVDTDTFNNVLSSFMENESDEKFGLNTKNGVALEMILLGESCLEHCGETRVPVLVLEQWMFNCIHQSNSERTSSLPQTVDEIHTYFEKSTIGCWLKEHASHRRHKLTHRLCEISKSSPYIGESILLPTSEVFSGFVFTERGHSFQSSVMKGEGSTGVQLDDEGCCPFDSSTRSSAVPNCPVRIFPPVRSGTSQFVELKLITSKHLPEFGPHCPFCFWKNVDSKSFLHSELITREQSLLNEDSQNSIRRLSKSNHQRGIDENNALSQCDDLHCFPTSFELPTTKKLISPTLVMNDMRDQFFQDDETPYELLPFETDFSFSDSASSTLTKKPRATNASELLTDSNDNWPQLESPPRKQQRVCSNISSSVMGLSPSGITSAMARTGGTMDKVIAKFSLLNVERDLCSDQASALQAMSKSSNPMVALDLNSPGDHSRTSGIKSHAHDTTAKLERVSSCRPDPESILTKTSQNSKVINERNNGCSSVPLWPFVVRRDGTMYFNRRTGLPLQSSPVPLKRSTSGKFDFDESLCSLRTSKSMTQSVMHSLTDNSDSSTNVVAVVPKHETDSNSLHQARCRPSSLRLQSSVDTCQFAEVNSTRHVAPSRRRFCSSDSDQEEMSSSAPPSGARGLSIPNAGPGRISRTLACTPMSHGSSQHLLVNFEESILNRRIHPLGRVDGFSLELGACGSFFPTHHRLPIEAYFYDLADDNTPSPYFGYADLSTLPNKNGYHVPKKGSIQLTLFNPNQAIVKIFVVGYDLEDMPPNSRTFLRQRTVYMPTQTRPDDSWGSEVPPADDRYEATEAQVKQSKNKQRNFLWSPTGDVVHSSVSSLSSCSSCSSITSASSANSVTSLESQRLLSNDNRASDQTSQLPVFLRYLIHLRFQTSRSGRVYLHTDVRLIFARDQFEFDPRVANYELRLLIDAPSNPRYSPKKLTKRPYRANAPGANSCEPTPE